MGILNRLKSLLYADSIVTQRIENEHQSLKYWFRAERLASLTLTSNQSGISDMRYCDADIVVSLTSYGKRLYDVYLTIESIMQQSMKPNKIVLWLADDLKDMVLPRTLLLQQERGLEIKYCRDIRSYKKLIPSLKEYPESAIITIDDDLIYEMDLIERLVNAYIQDSSYIYASRMHRIRLKNKSVLLPYNQWEFEIPYMDVSPLNFPTTGAGTLFPPHCFDEEVFNEKVFLNMCNSADDIWFKAMSLYSGIQSKRVFTHSETGTDYLVNPNVQDMGLYVQNVINSQNDIQLKAVFDYYNLYHLLE